MKKIEGIGPKIEEILHTAGITTFSKLAEANAQYVKSLLDAAGSRFRMHDPATWAKQAELAFKGDWATLAKWQEELKAGKEN